jgi:hypothetical protein
MYETPTLERYGTFRELTMGGGTFRQDGLTSDTNDDGCRDPVVPGEAVCTFSA